jgi:hypothetical protein
LAQSLSDLHSAGGNGGVSRAVFLELLTRHEDVDRQILDAKEEVRSLNRQRKTIRKTAEADGINVEALDRYLVDSKRSGSEREAVERQYRRYMAFSLKPVGFQPGMDFTTDDPGLAALNTAELKRIDNEGFAAGKAGQSREANSYSPGHEAFQRWDTAWLRGQGEIASSLATSPAAAQAARNAAVPGERRGRRRTGELGAVPTNEKAGDPAAGNGDGAGLRLAGGNGAAPASGNGAEPKRRGRPIGSTNRPKPQPEAGHGELPPAA